MTTRSVQLDPELVPLLELGLRSPSGDNCQPWVFRVTAPDTIEVHFDEPRGRAFLDFRYLASRMSFGALLEGIVIAASRFGTGVQIDLAPPGDTMLWATLTFSKVSKIAPDPLHDALEARSTNRQMFRPAKIDAGFEARLQAEVAPGVIFGFTTSSGSIERLAVLAGGADWVRLTNETAHDDLQKWLRWSDETATSTADGLDTRLLGVGPPLLLALRMMRSWSVASVLNALGSARMGANLAKQQAAAASGIGILATKTGTPLEAISVGRSFLRVWLRATQAGLAFCPMAALSLLALRMRLADGQGLAPRAIKVLEPLMTELNALFGLDPAAIPLMQFRVGDAPPNPVRSMRRTFAQQVIA